MATTSGPMGLDIISMRKATEAMQPYQRQDCPVCSWMLRTSVDGIIECPFCGWTSQNPIRRDIER